MTSSIIQYSSRTYSTILADINSVAELKDKPEWYKRLWAGVGDMLSMMCNAQANNSYLETAFTETAVDKLLALIDYERSAKTTSSGTVLLYIRRTASFPVSLAQAEVSGSSQGSLSVSSMRFEGRAGITFTFFTETATPDHTTNEFTVARNYYTGDLIRLTTTGTLPTADGGDLAIDTDYYVINVSATKIKLARTLALALAGTAINITSNGSGTHTANLFSYPVTMYQQTSVSGVVIGTSDGMTEFQEFDLPDKNVIPDTLVVVVGGITFTKVTTFANSLPTDYHFKFGVKSDDTSYILFGNGSGTSGYGAIPPAFDVEVSYAYGGGANSNVTVLNKINSYTGGNSDVDFICNVTAMNGGNDRESVYTAKRLAPILLKSRDRFVTVADGEALAVKYGGIAQCKIHKNIYGVGSCQVVIAPYGGGVPSSALKSGLQAYLISKTILESADVRVVDPTYVTVNVTSNLKIISGYSTALIQDYYELALSLIFSTATTLIKETYENYGIASAIDLINTTFSYSFTTTDYSQIQNLLEAITPVNFNDTIQISDVYGIVSGYIPGVDYCTISVPSFPVTLGTDEITEIGTITTTVI